MTTETAGGPFAKLTELLGMIRFSHTLFALPFALLGALMAGFGPGSAGAPGIRAWLGILLAMVFARSASMAFNRLIDRDIDARNPRTASRHLPTGRLSIRTVRIFCALSALGFIASTLLFLPENAWPLRLSAPVLLWLLGYSYSKRFTSLAHLWLGISLGLAPVAAWIAIRGALDAPPLWLGLVVTLWVTGFDLIYACQDVEFDRSAGLRSLPARLGVDGALYLSAVFHGLMIFALGGLWHSFEPFGTIFLIGILVVAILLMYEHAVVKPNDLSRVNLAFFQLNVVVSVGVLIVGAADLMF